MGIFNFFKRPLKIGLALGSGGIRGLAHISVLKVLEENRISIDFISGSSVGSLIGGFYCAGFSASQIEEIAYSLDRKKVFSLFFDPGITQGLVKGEKVKKFIEDYIGKITFENLKIPFCSVATDLNSGKAVFLKEGFVSEAIMASIALPLLFKPVTLNNMVLIDGGVSMPVPVAAVKSLGANLVIAINLVKDFFLEEDEVSAKINNIGIPRIVNNSISILVSNLANENVKNADFTFFPEVKLSTLNFLYPEKEKRKVIKRNQELFKKKLPLLKKKIAEKRLKVLFGI